MTFWFFDENIHENGHDENQENEANQNVLNVIVQEDNDEMNNAMIVEDSVDKLIPRNSFDLVASISSICWPTAPPARPSIGRDGKMIEKLIRCPDYALRA